MTSETLEAKGFRWPKVINRKTVGLTMTAIGIASFSAGMVDSTAAINQMSKQVNGTYPPVSNHELTIARNEITVFDQEINLSLERNGNLSSALTNTETAELSKDLKIVSQENERNKYYDQLNNSYIKSTKGIRDAIGTLGGYAMATGGIIMLGLSLGRKKRS